KVKTNCCQWGGAPARGPVPHCGKPGTELCRDGARRLIRSSDGWAALREVTSHLMIILVPGISSP
ncbi:hypothetical protein ACJX0J_039525, partial [Zea mays]